MMSNPYGYLKKCRRCKKEQHASKFPKQRPAPGQMPLCQSCRDEIAAEKANAD